MKLTSVLLALVLATPPLLLAAGCDDADTAVDGGASKGDGGGCGPPVAHCDALCRDLCARVDTCGRAAPDCAAACGRAYACPGETPGQDEAICSNDGRDVASASCDDLCVRGWATTTFRPCVDAGDGG